MNQHLKKIEMRINQYQLTKRTRYIPYMSHHVFAIPYIKFLSHAVTPLNQQWHYQAENGFRNPLTDKDETSYLHYVRSFMIEDFDTSKDYHLNVEGVQQPFMIYMNQSYVGTVNGNEGHIEFDMTHAVNGAMNEIELVPTETTTEAMMSQQQNPFQDMYVLERANDRIVNYSVNVSQNTRGDISVRIQIQDIEGAPLISYLLQNEQHVTFAKGLMDIDSSYHLVIPAHLVEQQGKHFTLFLETEDETIAHYIDSNGEHEPINVKTV
ncbi:hypothetical protein GZH82_03210 [Staphylococcus ursi]|uniref:hypothetical protein n=1 Tax=Staphylococcus sp. MI 10-1553 TaxID=1912064 RepID=UPI001398575E|nr:hypothetical protein [Staphylococcus sp. MI 10-1553]QHW36439.1 hypothetical protein GZH82_03210 [Staphylococcus sp. MI 10-1553]